MPYFGRTQRILTIFVERQSDNEAARLECGSAANELGNWRTLARASKNETGGRGDYPQRVADREPDSSLTIIDGQKPTAVTDHEHNLPVRQCRIIGVHRRYVPCTICWKNSLLLRDRAICLSKNSIASTSGISARKLRSRYTRLSSS